MKNKSSKKSQKLSAGSNDSDKEEHDLTLYAGDCIKLMGEVFKILGDKKLKAMVPKILKPISTNDLKAAMVEESMALSKKRICAILNGDTISSSSDEESDDDLPDQSIVKKEKHIKKEVIDVISLDGISSGSDIFVAEGTSSNQTQKKSKKKHKKSKKHAKTSKKAPSVTEIITIPSNDEEKSMTALELLELQARARAIKSQLAIVSTATVEDDIVSEPVRKNTSEHTSDKDAENQELDKFKSKKIKLRRDHLRPRQDEQSTNGKHDEDGDNNEAESEVVAKPTKQPVFVEVQTTPKRRDSTDSIILESPTHPLIIIDDSSSEDEVQQKNESVTDKTEEKVVADETKSPVQPSTSNENIQKETGPIELADDYEEGEVVEGEGESEQSRTNKPSIEIISVETVTEHDSATDTDTNTQQTSENVIETGEKNNVLVQEIDDAREVDLSVDKSDENCEKNDEATTTEEIPCKNTDSDEKVVEKTPEKVSSDNENNDESSVTVNSVNEENNKVVDPKSVVVEDDSTPTMTKSAENDESDAPVCNDPESPPESATQGDESNSKDRDDDDDCIVIDLDADLDSDTEESYPETSNWKSRWLQSKRVKDVIQTSKLCNNMKKKIVRSRKEPKSSVEEDQKEDNSKAKTTEVNEGSIGHYKALTKSSSEQEECVNAANESGDE